MGVRPKVVIVLGMHRSGTSLAAEMLVRLGAHTRARLLEPNKSNERGYWEDADVVDLHDSIFATLERPWGDWSAILPLTSGWPEHPAVLPFRRRLEKLISSTLDSATGPWMFKDPRLCRLLPLWRAIAQDLDFDLSAVLSVRSPKSVAASLAARDKIPVSLGRLLWLVHYLDCCRFGADLIQTCVSYDRWFTEPENQALALASAAGFTAPAAFVKETALSVVSEALRHQPPSDEGEGSIEDVFHDLHGWAVTGLPPATLTARLGAAESMLKEVHAWIGTTGGPQFDYLGSMMKAEEYRRAYQASAALNVKLRGRADEYRVAYQTSAAKNEGYRAAYQASADRCRELERLIGRMERPLRLLQTIRTSLKAAAG